VETVAMAYIFIKEEVLLVKHKKEDRYMSCGGHVEPGESLKDALIREIWEELGISVDFFDTKEGFEPRPFVVMRKGDLQIFEYLCRGSLDGIQINSELGGYKLFSRGEIASSPVLQDIQKSIILDAFEHLGI
jgi:8-oxo-dGTP pyrophosphatase MutT (NUDIX family)